MAEAMGMAFDVLLGLALIGLALRVVASRQLFESIVFFIVFGLLMAISWARLDAPHLALAEAAIGAGITGALLLTAYRDLVAGRTPDERAATVLVYRLRWPLAVLAGLVFAALGASLLMMPPEVAASAGAQARALVERTGVEDPVTAVLLDFRAYDTLLEMGVLLLAVLGARVVMQGGEHPEPADPWAVAGKEAPMVTALVGMLTPLIIVVAGYLLWVGAHGPGGAFQAGAVLAALGVLLRLTGRLLPVAEPTPGQRGVLVAGLAVFSAVGMLTLATGRAFLEYPPALAYPLILLIEIALMLSIALPLVLLFSGSAGLTRRPRGAP
jgi:multisubunit Na+/H+ antiporter MnhB subunit